MTHHFKAMELALGIESGIYDPDEVIAWADGYLAQNEYDDDMANVSLAGSKSKKELISLLRKLSRDQDPIEAMRIVLGRMARAYEDDEYLAETIVSYCERFWISQDYELPNDMIFMAGIYDEFDLAVQGIYGTKEQAMEELRIELDRFKKYIEQNDSQGTSVAENP